MAGKRRRKATARGGKKKRRVLGAMYALHSTCHNAGAELRRIRDKANAIQEGLRFGKLACDFERGPCGRADRLAGDAYLSSTRGILALQGKNPNGTPITQRNARLQIPSLRPYPADRGEGCKIAIEEVRVARAKLAGAERFLAVGLRAARGRR